MGFTLFFVSGILFIMLGFYLYNFIKSYNGQYRLLEAYKTTGRIINAETGEVTKQDGQVIIP